MLRCEHTRTPDSGTNNDSNNENENKNDSDSDSDSDSDNDNQHEGKMQVIAIRMMLVIVMVIMVIGCDAHRDGDGDGDGDGVGNCDGDCVYDAGDDGDGHGENDGNSDGGDESDGRDGGSNDGDGNSDSAMPVTVMVVLVMVIVMASDCHGDGMVGSLLRRYIKSKIGTRHNKQRVPPDSSFLSHQPVCNRARYRLPPTQNPRVQRTVSWKAPVKTFSTTAAAGPNSASVAPGLGSWTNTAREAATCAHRATHGIQVRHARPTVYRWDMRDPRGLQVRHARPTPYTGETRATHGIQVRHATVPKTISIRFPRM